MAQTLHDLLPETKHPETGDILDRFLTFTESRGITLYPAQENAILELFEGKNVILNTPTGSGKSLVAMAAQFLSLAKGHRSVYTCPVKALVNEKWQGLCREFGPENVGLSTGDASVNRDAPILCCTAEILANIALHEGEKTDIQDVIMDEFHYYADHDRGVAWQIPLLTLPYARFLIMSATLGDTTFFETALNNLTRRPTVCVASSDRPVPLEFEYTDIPLPATVERLIANGQGPVYVVHFTQLDAAQNAQSFTSLTVSSREEKEVIAQSLSGFKFSSPYGPDIKRWLRAGIGIHHAGLLPKYRILVEQLAQKGLLKVICGTDTLGVGINVPIRTVLFTRLCKFDGQKTRILSARDFHQISGRAGRKGFDDKGWVVAQAPDHVVENIALEQKRAKSGKKVVKRKPPERNFVNWDKSTFERLIAAPPERLVSRFQVSHAMLLNVLGRDGDGCTAMRSLIDDSHEADKMKELHRKRAWQLFRSLVERNIVEFIPRTSSGAKIRVNVELQDDFSMAQTLSLFLIESIGLLDPQDPDYALRLLTLIESILENPEFILRKQLDKVKSRKMAEMKLEGVPFEERIEELEKLEYPKPDREFVYTAFNEFSDCHPWIGQENIRPKSVVREMFETFSSFADYVRDYKIQRAEGLLLRHINSVYKVLTQTVPEAAKDDTLREMEIYLRDMLHQVDSSLLDAWEKMRNPAYAASENSELLPPGAATLAADITKDPRMFTASVRATIFSFLSVLSRQGSHQALATLADRESTEEDIEPTPVGVTTETSSLTLGEELRVAFEQYREEHGMFKLDPEARNNRHTYVNKSSDNQSWTVQQILVDDNGFNDTLVEFYVHLADSRAAGRPAVRFVRMGVIA